MLSVLVPPRLQLVLHGVHVLLNVIHDPAKRKGTPAQSLNRDLKLLNFFGYQVSLFLPSCFRYKGLLLIERMKKKESIKTRENACCTSGVERRMLWRLLSVKYLEKRLWQSATKEKKRSNSLETEEQKLCLIQPTTTTEGCYKTVQQHQRY